MTLKLDRNYIFTFLYYENWPSAYSKDSLICNRVLFMITFINYTNPNNKQASHTLTKKSRRNDGPSKNTEWKFEEYLKKFEPRTVWEQIDKQKKYHGRNITNEEQTELMFRGMDPTEEMLKLKIQNGNAQIIVGKDARRGWKPDKNLVSYNHDKFQLRPRLYELMKQAIYQARNKMIVMQEYREKYRNSSLYRMGFLMNKADNSAKIFGKFSFRAFRTCLLSREGPQTRFPVQDILTANGKQLNLWFDLELLVDIIKQNDRICKAIFKNHTEGRAKAFDLAFVP